MATLLDATTQERDLSGLRDRLETSLGEAGIPTGTILRATLVVEELVSNAFDHGAASSISLAVTLSSESLSIEVRDDGIPFDPTMSGKPDIALDLSERPVGGLGLHLVQRIARDLAYRRDAGANVVSVDLSLEARGAPHDISGASPYAD